MKMTKRFSVLPEGIIKGGLAYYTVDPETGVIDYYAEVKAKVLFFTQTKKYEGQYKVDPIVLRPDSYKGLGIKQAIGNVEFEVVAYSIQGEELTKVSVKVIGEDMRGIAVIDQASPELIEIRQLDAQVKAMGMDLNLRLRELG